MVSLKTHGGIVVTEGHEEGKRTLNKDTTTEINRGVELLLRNRRRTERPKTFQVKFGKLIALWNREIVFHLNFYLDIRKK